MMALLFIIIGVVLGVSFAKKSQAGLELFDMVSGAYKMRVLGGKSPAFLVLIGITFVGIYFLITKWRRK